MAIDERRNPFSIHRWKNDSRVLQVWFAGVHSDVGGGYKKQGLSDIALEWMIYRAFSHGLEFKKRYLDENVFPNAKGTLHKSYKGIWRVLGEHDRHVLTTDFVHHTVEKRLQETSYSPDNLPASPRYWRP